MAASGLSPSVWVVVENLAGHVTTLISTSDALRTSIVEDCPATSTGPSAHKALQDLAQAAEDFDDAVQAARTALGRTMQGGPDLTVVAVLRALLCAEHVLRDELVPVGGRFDVARRVADGWGAQWGAWSRVVRVGLLDAAQALSAAEKSAADVIAGLLDSPPTDDYEEVVP